MESLKHFKEYIERFQALNFNEFSEIYYSLYSDCKNLENRVEFSLIINPTRELDLRFGLFKLYDPQKILSLFTDLGVENSNLENILSSTKNYVPEFAVGFDFNKTSPRTKIYFLRLPDNSEFNKSPNKIIDMTSKLINVNLTNYNKQEKKDCYLMAIDFYQNNKQNLKIYHRDENVDFNKVNNNLKMNNVESQYFNIFQELFFEGQFKDITFSKKYTQHQNGPTGLSVFFEVGDFLNDSVDQLVKTCVSEKYLEFKEIVRTLDKNKPVRYSHIGITFSKNMKDENICLYFSPMLGEIKK